MKKLIPLFLISFLMIGCRSTKLTNRPQVIYSNKDSSFVLIKGNSLHFQQRADYKKRKLAERNKTIVNN